MTKKTNRAWSTVAKREHATTKLIAAAKNYPGVTIERLRDNDIFPRHVELLLRKGPYYCSVYFNGGNLSNCLVIPWNVETRSSAKYPADFSAGHVNQHHHQKATSVADTLNEAIWILKMGFAALPDALE